MKKRKETQEKGYFEFMRKNKRNQNLKKYEKTYQSREKKFINYKHTPDMIKYSSVDNINKNQSLTKGASNPVKFARIQT